jgi:hypothetical protein
MPLLFGENVHVTYSPRKTVSCSILAPSSNTHQRYHLSTCPPPKHPHPQPTQWLEIKPGDDEKTIARKKKLLKSYKSKKRFQQMDIKQKERADSWQSFLKGKGSKPKQGGCWEREGQETNTEYGCVGFSGAALLQSCRA